MTQIDETIREYVTFLRARLLLLLHALSVDVNQRDLFRTVDSLLRNVDNEEVRGISQGLARNREYRNWLRQSRK